MRTRLVFPVLFICVLSLGCVQLTGGPGLTDSEKNALLFSLISKVGITDSSVNVSRERVFVRYGLPEDMTEESSWFAIAGAAAAVSGESEKIVLHEYVDGDYKKQVQMRMADVKDLIAGKIDAEEFEINVTEGVSKQFSFSSSVLQIIQEKTVKNVSKQLVQTPVKVAVPIKQKITPVEVMTQDSVKQTLQKLGANEVNTKDFSGIKSKMDEVKNLEDDLSTVGDDAQLSNLELQDAMQKQQQMMQMLSNIMKSMHDTQMSIIRNMK